MLGVKTALITVVTNIRGCKGTKSWDNEGMNIHVRDGIQVRGISVELLMTS